MINFVSINISYIREKNYLKRKELAEKYNLSSAAIGSYERGKSLPTITFIQKFCHDFNINIDDFVNKDLSKEKSHSKGYINEPVEAYNIEEKTITVYERLIDNYKKQLDSQSLLDAQHKDLLKHNQQIITNLKHELEKKNAIINQNALGKSPEELVAKIIAYIKADLESKNKNEQ